MSFIPNTTPTPNWLYNGEMKKMSDTELRVVLIITRATLGWVENKQTGQRKQEDWISQRLFMERSGKSNRSISTAIESCLKNKWIETYDSYGNKLDTPEMRSGKKVIYQLGNIFTNKLKTSEKTSQVRKTSEVISKSSEDSSQEPVKIVHSTKETIKETREKENAPTNFFTKKTIYGELKGEFYKKGIKQQLVDLEFSKFIDYWTEPNQRGKQRWELQKTFEVGRRLRTWFSRVNKF